jgi:cell division transport system permease protein
MRFRGIHVILVIALSLVLILLGIAGIIYLHGTSLEDKLKENFTIQIMLKPTASEAEISLLQHSLETNEKFSSVTFISSTKIIEDLQAEFGDLSIENLQMGNTPLPSIIEATISAEYLNDQIIKNLATELTQNNIVDEVYYPANVLAEIEKNKNTLSTITLLIAIIILVIAITLLSLTIRLTIYSRRFTIRTMLLVGAKKSFIQKPFMLDAFILGLISSIIAIIGLEIIIRELYRLIPELNGIVTQQYFIFLFVAIFIIGIIITELSTLFSVNKYIKMKTDSLFH